MKATSKRKETGFEPIELTITIESKKELVELWHRLNVSPNYIKKSNSYENRSSVMGEFNDNNCMDSFVEVDSRLKTLLGLDPY